MSGWSYSPGIGMWMIDRTMFSNMSPQLYPSIYNTSNGVSILTSNVENYGLKVNGSGYFASNLSFNNSNNNLSYTSNPNWQGIQVSSQNGFGVLGNNNPLFFARNDSMTVVPPLISSSVINSGQIDTVSIQTNDMKVWNSSNIIQYTSNINVPGGLDIRGWKGIALGTTTNPGNAPLFIRDDAISAQVPVYSSFLSNANNIQTTGLKSDYLQIISASNYLNFDDTSRTLNFVAEKRGLFATSSTGNTALVYDSNGIVTIFNSLNIGGSLNSPITTFSSNTSAWASNNIVAAAYASNIAARQNIQINLTLETFMMYYFSPYNGSYPIGDGMKNGNSLPNAIFHNSFTSGLSNARLVLRAIPNIQNQIVTGPLDCYCTVMRCTSAEWNDWTPFLTASGSNARLYLDTTRFMNGAKTGVSDWFVYPSNVSVPLWLGIRIDTNSTAMNTYGLYYMNSYLDVY